MKKGKMTKIRPEEVQRLENIIHKMGFDTLGFKYAINVLTEKELIEAVNSFSLTKEEKEYLIKIIKDEQS